MVKAMECQKCGRVVENIGELAVKVTCSYCTMMMAGLPEETKSTYKPTGRPAGWHWMSEFVDKDGNVFHKGKEMKKLNEEQKNRYLLIDIMRKGLFLEKLSKNKKIL